MKITIRRNQLVAALFTAADNDIRYYLNGVRVEANATETRIISTNGHVVSVQRFETTNDVETLAGITVPREILEKLRVDRKNPDATVALVGEKNEWRLEIGDMSVAFKPIDGTFPDYCRVIPREVSGEVSPTGVDVGHFSRFVAAAKALGHSDSASVLIKYNGEGHAIVRIIGEPDYLGVLAGMRVTAKCPREVSLPDWAHAPLEESLV